MNEKKERKERKAKNITWNTLKEDPRKKGTH